MTTRKTTKTKAEPMPAPAMSDNAYIAIPLKEYRALLAKAAGQPLHHDDEGMYFWIDKYKRECDRILLDRVLNGHTKTYKIIRDMNSEQLRAWTEQQLNP